MGDWYTIGLALGLGTALGVLFAGLLSATPLGRGAAVVLAGAAGAVVGLARSRTGRSSSPALVGGVVGAARRRDRRRRRAAARRHAGRARADRRGRRSGPRRARVRPVAGYLEAVALPVLAVRLRRTQAERYAGLRTLAK